MAVAMVLAGQPTTLTDSRFGHRLCDARFTDTQIEGTVVYGGGFHPGFQEISVCQNLETSAKISYKL